MVLKLFFGCSHNISSSNSERADKPEKKEYHVGDVEVQSSTNDYDDDQINLKRKKMISTPLMMENPVRSPMVPPIRLSWASVLIFLSLSILSKVAVSK